MNDDILDWLKMWADYPSVKATYGDKISRAATEIERLRAEIEKLQWELGKALDTLVVHDAVCAENAHLKEKLESKMGRLAYYEKMNKRDDAEEAFGGCGDE